MNLRDYAISSFEIEIAFRKVLSMEYIRMIGKIIQVLGQYMVLDRDMLQERLGEKISLKYIVKAINLGIITELQYADDQGERDIFFFQLSTGGIYILEKDKCFINKLPLLTDEYGRERVLMFNRYALDKGYEVSMSLNTRIGKNLDCFVCTDQKDKEREVVCYFPDMLKEHQVFEMFRGGEVKKDGTILRESDEEVLAKFRFEKINTPRIRVGNKTKGTKLLLESDTKRVKVQ